MSIQRFILLSLGLSLILEHSSQAEQNCQEFLTQHNRQQVNNLRVCKRMLSYKSGVEEVRKSTCILKCTLERLGLINEDGVLIGVENLQIYTEKNFPKFLQSHASARLSSCLTGIANNGFPNEDTCKQYEPFIKCITTTYRQLCRSPSEPNKRPNTVEENQAVATGHIKHNNQPENILRNLFYIAAL